MFDHRRDVSITPKKCVEPVKVHGEGFADMRFITETGKPLTLRVTANDLSWLLAWGQAALDELNKGESTDG